MKTLKTVVVKGWKNPRTELDERYTTGVFSEPALYVYDLRSDTGQYVPRDIGRYITSKCTRLQYDPVEDKMVDQLKHPIHFFVDEWEYDWQSLKMFDFDRIAYIRYSKATSLPPADLS